MAITPYLSQPSNNKKKIEKTPILKKPYIDNITARTQQGKERAIVVKGMVPELGVVDMCPELTEEEKDEIKVIGSMDAKGNVCCMKEKVYWWTNGTVLSNYSSYIAAPHLDKLVSIGLLRKYSDWEYTKGVAREAQGKKSKSISDNIIKLAKYLIDNKGMTLLKHARAQTIVKIDTIFWPNDPVKQAASKNAAEAHETAKYPDRCEKLNAMSGFLVEVKGEQEDNGLSISLLALIVDRLIPCTHPNRRNYIIKHLGLHYGLWQQYADKHKKGFGDTDPVVPRTSDTNEPKELVIPEALDHVSVYDTGIKLTAEPTEEAEESLLTDCTNLGPQELRQHASEIIEQQLELNATAFNEALIRNIISYQPQDDLDIRQIAMMVENGPLPTAYQTVSSEYLSNSPRVYSTQKDNLFYSRKVLRYQAMKGMNLVDIDLQSCHVQIALGLWETDLPLLKQEVEQGSLWKSYEHFFTSNQLPFYKSLVKAMHHATLLGGGKRAYKKAIHRFNLANPDNKIDETLEAQIVKTYSKNPIRQEVARLFNKLGNQLDGKQLTTMTGESMYVVDRTKDLETGEMIEGNVLTAIASILQSVEVTIISYLIVRCQQLFIPVLWQHDGLTIKPLYSNTVELMQQELDKFIPTILGRTIKLETTEL